LSNSLEGNQPRVLLVDDDRLFVEIVQDMLHKEGVQTGVAFGGEEALELFEEGGWDVVVTDVVMDHMSGIDLLREIQETGQASTGYLYQQRKIFRCGGGDAS
jgi:CheY-like chemotaxis protein